MGGRRRETSVAARWRGKAVTFAAQRVWDFATGVQVNSRQTRVAMALAWVAALLLWVGAVRMHPRYNPSADTCLGDLRPFSAQQDARATEIALTRNPVAASLLRTSTEAAPPKLLFLVARASILDPFFAHSVVLMLPLQAEPLIVGLVVNKPTRVPLTQIFPESPGLKDRSDPAYIGGPVDLASPALAFHTHKPPKDAMPLYGDVYLSFDLKFITKLLHDSKQAGDVRLFLGRAQWAPEQLRGEALEGSWYNLRVEGDVIFEHDTEHLWKRLHDRARPPAVTPIRMLLPHLQFLTPASANISS
jgi:putative transcriptional regulator